MSGAIVEVLERLLRPDDPVHAALRAQLPYATASPGCACGCVTIDIGLPEDAPRAPVDADRRPVVAEADIVTAEGGPLGQVLVLAENGHLARLEVCSWGDHPIAAWPLPERLVLPAGSGG